MILHCCSNYFVFSEYCISITSLGVGLLSLLVAILTLWTAQTINKNITIKKYIYERQIDTIFKLINDLQALKFVVMDSDGNINVLSYSTLENQVADGQLAQLADKKMLVTAEFFNKFPVINYSGNPFTPPEIVKQIDALCFKPTIAAKRQQFPGYVVISCGSEDLNTVSRVSKSSFDTFGDFAKAMTELKTEIRNWTKGKLNL